MLVFPVRYTFHVVGLIRDDASSKKFVEDVKTVVLEISGDENAKWEVLQRGEKFIKVKCEVEVSSSRMMNKIYMDISNIDGTLMRF